MLHKLPELNVVLVEEEGIPDIHLVTCNSEAAWDACHQIIKKCGDLLDESEAVCMDRAELEHEYADIDGKWYAKADQYGSVHARVFGAELVGTANQSFGSYFQTVLSHLAEKHEWEDPYAMIAPGNHDGRWIDKILVGYLQNSPAQQIASQIFNDNMENGSK